VASSDTRTPSLITMMESRKRPLEDIDGVAAKKRLLNSASGSPLANGNLDSEEPSHVPDVEVRIGIVRVLRCTSLMKPFGIVLSQGSYISKNEALLS
jgi:hypothetical protein